MGRGIRAAALVVCAVVLSACAGGERQVVLESGPRQAPDAEAVDAAEVTTSTATPTTTAAPVDPAQTYLSLVSETNCVLDRVVAAEEAAGGGDEYLDPPDWPAVRDTVLPLVTEYSDALIRFYEGLVGAAWPAEVQPDIDTLVSELTSEAVRAREVAASSSLDEYLYLVQELRSSTNTAGTIRAKLGLPSNVTDESDYCTG